LGGNADGVVGNRGPDIDVYSLFAGSPDPGRLYRVGDTHWNNNGLQVWIGLVNKLLSGVAGK